MRFDFDFAEAEPIDRVASHQLTTFAKSSKSPKNCSSRFPTSRAPSLSGGGGACLGVIGLLSQRRLANFFLGLSGRRAAVRTIISFASIKTLRTTPAMAANVTKRLWEIGDIVDVLEAWENTT